IFLGVSLGSQEYPWECCLCCLTWCPSWKKGVLIMTLFPLTDCCAMLGIDPKTLRHWLNHANLPLAAHPTEARINWLTLEHVQQLASLHARPLLSPVSASAARGSFQEQASPKQESETA